MRSRKDSTLFSFFKSLLSTVLTGHAEKAWQGRKPLEWNLYGAWPSLCHLLAALSSREKVCKPWWAQGVLEFKTVKCSGWFVRRCSAHPLLRVRFIENTPPPHAYPSLGSCITWHSLEKLNWRQSIRRLWGLEEGSSSESWLSSQEVLFLTALHKHWKRDAKKGSQTHYFHCKHLLYCPAFRSSGAACVFYICVCVRMDPGFRETLSLPLIMNAAVFFVFFFAHSEVFYINCCH